MTIPIVKLRADVHFPSKVIGTTGIEVTKQNGNYTIETDWTDFGSISAIPTSPTSYILTFDSATGVYVLVPSHLLGGATAGIADAPNDGVQYGRQSAGWTVIAPPGTAEGDYDTRATVVATSIASAVTHLRTAGYYAVGDGGGALYKKVLPIPTHAGKIQSADGAWWEIAETTINVHQFGAKGDGTTDDSAAINNAIFYMKLPGGNVYPTLRFGHPSAFNYKIASPLNFTQMRNLRTTVDFENGVLLGVCTGQPIIDALDSHFVEFKNGFIFGDASLTPSYGIQMGRGIKNGDGSINDAANCQMSNMTIVGTYSVASFLNTGMEVFRCEKCLFWNQSNSGDCVVQDGRNAAHITSTFFTVTIPHDTYTSFLDNLYENCNFEQIGPGPTKTGAALRIIGSTSRHRFMDCYAQCNYASAIQLSYDHYSMILDIHCESSLLVNNVLLLASVSAMHLLSFKLVEAAVFGTNAVIAANGTGNLVTFYNSEIEVDQSLSNVPIFGTGGTINYHGKIKIGENTSNYDLSHLNSFTGELELYHPESGLTLPGVKSVTVSAQESVAHNYYGAHSFHDTIRLLPSPTTLVAAGTLNIPDNGTWFYVTGTTTITALQYISSFTGRFIILHFADGLTLTNSISGNLLLAGNFVAGTQSSITLYANGSAWEEISRSTLIVAV